MNKQSIIFAALVILLSASCQKMADMPDTIINEQEDTFLATTESCPSKTYLSGNDTDGYTVLWSSGDQITIGGYSGCLYQLYSGAGTTSAIFSNISGKTLTDGEYDSYYRMGSNNLPEGQTYYPDGVIKSAPMHAKVTVSQGKPQPAQYHNLCGLLRLRLKRSAAVSVNVSQITISADQPMSGAFDIVDYAAVMNEGENKETYLNCTTNTGKDGVALTTDGVDFYIALPAGSYSNVKVVVTDTNGSTCTKSLKGKTLDIVRSQITPASFTVEKFIPSSDILKAVDMGVSVLWANMNIGSITPNKTGEYFAWGETAWKHLNTYTMSNYFDTDDEGATFKKYYHNGGKTELDAEDDAAHVWWGGDWRMPTEDEWKDLIDNCDLCHISFYLQEDIGGVRCYDGFKLTSKINGNSIFLKQGLATNNFGLDVGNYWASTLYNTDNSYFGSHFTFSQYITSYVNEWMYSINGYGRENGGLIRPVCPKSAK